MSDAIRDAATGEKSETCDTDQKSQNLATASASPCDPRRDVVIGLIGAVGTRLDLAETALKDSLREYAYAYELIKLSDFIRQFPGYTTLNRDRMPRRDYYMKAIDGGNSIREAYGDKSALAQWAVVEINARRSKPLNNPNRGYCFVIDQLKCPEEVRFLREVYGALFYCIAIYADEDLRERRLTKEFQKPGEHKGVEKLESPAATRVIMDRDHKEKGKWGQDVRGAFVEADYFIRSDEHVDISAAITRFIALVFNKPYISPTKSEVAMMHAKAAALRSADLSRQVGAAIVARDGRILTTGCNEVPKAGGGQYWEDDVDDTRDFQLGYDANDRKKDEAIYQFLDKINDKIKQEFLEGGVRSLQRALEKASMFDDTLIDSLIEFGRIVHAEQAAMNASCLETISVRDTDLYCTTYPCHMCARQIVNVGIRNVIYIEPYPKSAAIELYGDSIEENPKLKRGDYIKRLNDVALQWSKVYFIPFEGVAPRRYSDLFTNGKRKATTEDVLAGLALPGDVIAFNPLDATPRLSPEFASPVSAEGKVSERMKPCIGKWIQKAREQSTDAKPK